ncbi:CDP-alcohol phosphatidyltransferase family protein [Maribacter sp. 2307ULW6-5]|uniref:CDP-alcohol phosphatidyltransferase family protein n=1 Tax=Maribacter sp. 2307ULW6-5 TaxID=3386275 RepID=UPI0039BC7F64
MSKLPKEHQFLDLSDYGRPFAQVIAKTLRNTRFTPIDVTLGFVFCGILAIVCILNQFYWAAAFFLVLKSILDAADGELARIKQTPSHTGRYLDSIADILLNFFILLAVWHISGGTIIWTILAFLGIQLQGTLYNYYYVILRNKFNGDTTSRVYEEGPPKALTGEKQKNVNRLFRVYSLLYGGFDRVIYRLDRRAIAGEHFPRWFMTCLSTFGLGFQLLVIGLLLVAGLGQFIAPFFIGYTALVIVFILVRKFINL